ncbi:hypothetical protein GCM10025872_13760 [Barrientosiimonas endolithica]|uniref:DUF3153 domain-containing protein n=1 Tax=Barrientosiimonas endolithica TaxID=1535208 RepID=A0ABM8H9W4_9MICO|nr:hypothetical protein GCM10025872_13760 [Barrientosiimonas endolithica]
MLWVVTVVTLLAGAGVTTAAALQGRDFFTTGYAPLRTGSAAMVTREIDVEGRRPTDPQNDPGDLARVRIQVRGIEPGRPVFVGIARRADVERYLRGTAHDEMSTFTTDPLRVSWTRRPGESVAPPPGEQPFWVATSQVTGPGTAELQWDKSLGEWMAVAMNADGSPGVQLEANVGLRFGFLLPAGLGLLALSLAGGAALVATRRRAAEPRAVRAAAQAPSDRLIGP